MPDTEISHEQNIFMERLSEDIKNDFILYVCINSSSHECLSVDKNN